VCGYDVAATEDGIVVSDGAEWRGGGGEADSDSVSDRRCHACSATFATIDALYAHQNELGHLELTPTPTGPGYLCWTPGCRQYFRTALGVQSHHRDVHSAATEYRHRCVLPLTHPCSGPH